jgi:hypothetical protein
MSEVLPSKKSYSCPQTGAHIPNGSFQIEIQQWIIPNRIPDPKHFSVNQQLDQLQDWGSFYVK